MDLTQYWYMFPVSLAVATLANATAVEGATFFSPIFMLALKVEPLTAIGTAIITEVFGFGSGVAAYMRRRLIDYGIAGSFLLVTVPLGVLGAQFAGMVPGVILKTIFGIGLLVIAISFLIKLKENCIGLAKSQNGQAATSERKLRTASNEVYCYSLTKRPLGFAVCGLGGLFMGLIGSGQGEANNYYFIRNCRIPGKVAVGTGAFVVAITALAASVGHATKFVLQGGEVLGQVLSLIIYTVPAVIIGGQLGPMLASRMRMRRMEQLLGWTFLMISMVTLWTTWGAIL